MIFWSHLRIPRVVLDDLWNLLPQKKNVSSCRGGFQKPAKHMPTVTIDRSIYLSIYLSIFFLSICRYITLHCIRLHYITLHYITLHYITWHCIALHCITLNYMTLHCIRPHNHYIVALKQTAAPFSIYCIPLYPPAYWWIYRPNLCSRQFKAYLL